MNEYVHMCACVCMYVCMIVCMYVCIVLDQQIAEKFLTITVAHL